VDRNCLVTALPLLGLLVALAAPAAQAWQEPQAPAFEEQVSVGYVLVPVVVRSGAGYAKNLDQNHFRVLVDDRPVKVESFERRAEAPASVVFLQDLSGSMANAGRLDVSREVVGFFTGHSLPGDEFAIATFAGGEVGVEVPFTSDLSVLREASQAWTAWGTTALHDAVAWLPEVSINGKNPKRFALLITDGVDNASKISPEQAREIVQKSQIPIYVLGLGSGSPFELTEGGKKVYRYADVLSLLASATGGRYFSISRPETLKEALDVILEDLRQQYVLGFATGDGPSRFRQVKVEVKGDSRRTIVFRRGYKGPPPASSPGG
jgi:VWFA-related protein